MKNKDNITKMIGVGIGVVPFIIIGLFKFNLLHSEFSISNSIIKIAQYSSILFFVTSVLIGNYYHKFQLKMMTIFNIILAATFSYLTIRTYPYLIEDINVYIIFLLILFSSILLFIGFCVGVLNRDLNV